MKRRTFLKTTAVAGLAPAFLTCPASIHSLPGILPPAKTHILSLSFDDGFVKSFYKVADIYEENGLTACLNIIASGHLPDFQQVDDWILPELMGSFDDWNALVERGHEVMPHSWKHLNLARQPLDEAKELIVKCLDFFEDNLNGYDNSKAVFNFPFNSSSPELEEFTLSKVRAIRTWGDSGINTMPDQQQVFRQACWTNGPKNIDSWVDKTIKTFLEGDGGWLILNVHGLDDEGWGPMSETFLKGLIPKLAKVENLEIAPVGEVLARSTK